MLQSNYYNFEIVLMLINKKINIIAQSYFFKSIWKNLQIRENWNMFEFSYFIISKSCRNSLILTYIRKNLHPAWFRRIHFVQQIFGILGSCQDHFRIFFIARKVDIEAIDEWNPCHHFQTNVGSSPHQIELLSPTSVVMSDSWLVPHVHRTSLM